MNAVPFIVNYGGGVDSTAMLIEFKRRGIRPDVILFANTGNEKPRTYEYVRMFHRWLLANGMPGVMCVRRRKSRPSKTGPGYRTLEGNCLQNGTLPSLAFRRPGCSLKWKVEPMDRWLSTWAPAVECWAYGGKPRKAIGYDAGPKDSRRAVNRLEDDRFTYWYPLREWGWTREDCEREILAEGLPLPPKSACYFCPASQKDEVRELAREQPLLFMRAIAMEDNARPNLQTIKGLGGCGSWSWREFAESEGFLTPRCVS